MLTEIVEELSVNSSATQLLVIPMGRVSPKDVDLILAAISRCASEDWRIFRVARLTATKISIDVRLAQDVERVRQMVRGWLEQRNIPARCVRALGITKSAVQRSSRAAYDSLLRILDMSGVDLYAEHLSIRTRQPSSFQYPEFQMLLVSTSGPQGTTNIQQVLAEGVLTYDEVKNEEIFVFNLAAKLRIGKQM
eukprot:8471691-Prorocentrum_lima.AAC.1